jgi:hypothetical protein
MSLVAVCWSSRASQVVIARFQLLEQSHVFDGDDRLVGEGAEQIDLAVREGAGRPPGD